MANNKKQPAKEFIWKDIQVIYRADSERGGGGTILRAGLWVVDGRETRAVVEKRDFWNEEGGGLKIGKAKGLNGSDLIKILERAPTLFPALGIPMKEVELALQSGGETKTWAEHAAATEAVPAAPAGEPF